MKLFDGRAVEIFRLRRPYRERVDVAERDARRPEVVHLPQRALEALQTKNAAIPSASDGASRCVMMNSAPELAMLVRYWLNSCVPTYAARTRCGT